MIRSSQDNDQNLTTPEKLEEDLGLEGSLRPTSFDAFIGQTEVIENLKVYIEAAKKRKEALDHVLLFGPPGLGKTTLSTIISKELNVNIKMSSGPVLERAGDLAGMLTNFSENDVFFIDEIHRISKVVEEYLYSAMEDYRIDIMIDKGPSARSVQLSLNPFTLVGATTMLGNLTSPMRDRFGVLLRLDFYDEKKLLDIVIRSAGILKIEIEEDAALEIARRSRGTPRIANRILRRTRDFAEVENKGLINLAVASKSLTRMGIDAHGLDEMDRKILLSIIEKFNGGPVGIDAIAVAVSEDSRTIEEVYEPYLIKEGFLQRLPRGRAVSEKCYKYFNIDNDNNKQSTIF